MSNRTTEAACLDCSTVVYEHDMVGGHDKPCPGDLSFCHYCGAAMIFESIEPLQFRRPTTEEMKDYATHPQIALARILVKAGLLP